MIDSDSSCDITDNNSWEYLKEMHVPEVGNEYLCKFQRGKFQTSIVYRNTSIDAELLALDGTERPLLDRSSAKKLGVLRVGPEINNITECHFR